MLFACRRLFRCIKFSKERAHEELTRELLIKLATTLEQGPLAGKAPKTVAACTMHLYCRHANVGMQAGRMIARSLQVGESTVRTNLRGIYVGAAGTSFGGTSQVHRQRPAVPGKQVADVRARPHTHIHQYTTHQA